MKRTIISCLLISFIFFFVGIGLILYASKEINEILMYVGLILFVLGTLGYTILGCIMFFHWYKTTSGVK